MNRRSLFTSAFAVAMMMGCSSPSDTAESAQENTGNVASSAVAVDCPDELALDCDGEASNGSTKVYTLTSFDGTTNTLIGVNAAGQTISASFTTSTNFRLANLNQFIPQEPVYPVLVSYNAAVQGLSDASVVGIVQQLTVYQIHARIGIKQGTTTIRAFRPVP